MTKEEILAMVPGSMLDELIAEKVMGWKVTYNTHKNGRESDYSWSSGIDDKGNYHLIKPCKAQYEDDCFMPSTDISVAWKVVEKMKKKLFSQRRNFSDILQEITSQSVDLPKATVINWIDMLYWITPEMICKAALLAQLKED